jgi:predicted nucleotidyltransferase
MAPARIPPEVTELAEQLLAAQRQVLGDRLLGLYLFGSATTGSFQAGISDIDTLAVLATDPSANDLAGLATMHERLIKDAPAWYDRVEVDYLSATALANFRTGSWPAARISPGEPFHPIQIDHRWVTDWYHVLISGVTLHGPPPQQFIPPISHSEFVEAVRQQLLEWPDRLVGLRPVRFLGDTDDSVEEIGNLNKFGPNTTMKTLARMTTSEYPFNGLA